MVIRRKHLLWRLKMRQSYRKVLKLISPVVFLMMLVAGCQIDPYLHLAGSHDVNIDVPIVQVDIDVYWNYDIGYNISYDWQQEWTYGWDSTDLALYGPIGYTDPKVYNIRRYYTAYQPYGIHPAPLRDQRDTTCFIASYEYGYYDFLIWNDAISLDGTLALRFDETTTYEYVTASTGTTPMPAYNHSKRFPNSFYQPEALFSAYKQAVYISEDPNDYDWYDPVKHLLYKSINMTLEPVTYIYLPQLIVHHNNGRIENVEGNGNLTGMSRSTNLNTGIAGSDAITVHFNTRFKKHLNRNGEDVDVAGGRLMTFGMCNLNPNRITKDVQPDQDLDRHYLGVPVVFNNGCDSTLMFDVTDQIRRRYKGGVITVEIDMDTVKIPSRPGGSGFNAVVQLYDSVIHEIEM